MEQISRSPARPQTQMQKAHVRERELVRESCHQSSAAEPRKRQAVLRVATLTKKHRLLLRGRIRCCPVTYHCKSELCEKFKHIRALEPHSMDEKRQRRALLATRTWVCGSR